MPPVVGEKEEKSELVDPSESVADEGIINFPPNTSASPETRVVVLFQFPVVAPLLKPLSCRLFSSSNLSIKLVEVVLYVSINKLSLDELDEEPFAHVSLACDDKDDPVPRYRKLEDDIDASVF